MGQFSWLYCDSGKQMVDGKVKNSYLLVPREFGGGHIVENCYNGYGRMGGHDVYDLVADWNREWASQNPDYVTYRGDKLSDYGWYPFYTDLTLSREEVIEKWKKTGDTRFWYEWRIIGIDLACYDEDNANLRYPIKIAEDEISIYERCRPSDSDPNQGWEEDEEDYDDGWDEDDEEDNY